MGKRGPPPTPTKLKVLRGNPGKRKINTQEPEPSAGNFACPTWMPATGKRIWRRIVPELQRIGLLSKVDKEQLVIFCEAYATWEEMTFWIQKNGAFYNTYEDAEDEDGNRILKYSQVRPQVTRANQAAQQVHRMAREFGFSPAARSLINVPREEIPDEDEAYFFGKA